RKIEIRSRILNHMVQYYAICGRAQERASKGRGPSVATSPIGWRIAVRGRDGNVETSVVAVVPAADTLCERQSRGQRRGKCAKPALLKHGSKHAEILVAYACR